MSHDYDCTRCRREPAGFACPLCGETVVDLRTPRPPPATEAPITCLELHFPHGATQGQCDEIARRAQKLVGAGVSEGGFKMTYMPMTAEEEKHRGCEFDQSAMSYTFGHKREAP